jgi:cytochrome c-type biogenesis protein CcmH/NrfG
MPAIPSEVQHAAMTDHRIPRQAKALPAPVKEGPGAGWPLTHFHGDQVDVDDAEAQRDLAVALMQFEAENPQLVSERHLRDVVPILEQALERDACDADVIEALAHAQFALNRTAPALATIEKGIQRAPAHEQLLAGALLIAAANREWKLAEDCAGRLIALNPHQVRYRQLAVQIALAKHDPGAAVKGCQVILDLNPADHETRQMLVEMLKAQRKFPEALLQADILQRSPQLKPPR